MRFQVPQNLDIPDTVFFGMSFKQLLYIGGGIGFLFVLYLVTGNFIISLAFGAPICALAGLLAFFRLNNQPFIVILQSMLHFVTKKRMYVWRQKSSTVYAQRKKRVQPGSRHDMRKEDGNHGRVQDLTSNLIFDDNPLDRQEPDTVI